MDINKHTAFVMNDLAMYTASQMDDLRSILPLLNLSDDERESIERAINTVECKVEEIKRSKVSELENHFEEHVTLL